MPFSDDASLGGGGAGAAFPEIIVEISAEYDVRVIDDAVIATGGGYAVNMPSAASAIKRIQITSRTGTVVLTADGSDLIDGVSQLNLTAGQSRTLAPIAGEWVTG